MYRFISKVRVPGFLGLFLGVALSLTSFSPVEADLIGRLEQTPGAMDYLAYYDTALDITWAANANLNGPASWANQVTWASGLTIGGVNGWRLPTADPTCRGFNCTDSEMGNLYYNELGNAFGSLTNTGPFSNLQGFIYWSGTGEAERPKNYAVTFYFLIGRQGSWLKGSRFLAWPVHDGDVPASAIPEPSTMWLFGSGVAGLAALRYRKSRNSFGGNPS